jgi:glutathione S-transferase
MQLEISPEVWSSFKFFGSLLLLKMVAMSILTAIQRFTHKVFANPEDVAHDKKNCKVIFNHPDVERVRRAHQNDIENILPFFFIGFLYCLINPVATTAILLFKVFTASRYIHTLVYAVYPVRQPARALAWAVGYGINIFMAVQVLLSTL